LANTVLSLQVDGPSNETILTWWQLVISIQARLHWHCTKRRYDQFGQPTRGDARKSDNESGFKEGGKKPPASDTDTAPSSRAHRRVRLPERTSNRRSQDVDMLMECRSVIVDLNTCWTHRHFSEDIELMARMRTFGKTFFAGIWSIGRLLSC
jgi:hypothetical protein